MLHAVFPFLPQLHSEQISACIALLPSIRESSAALLGSTAEPFLVCFSAVPPVQKLATEINTATLQYCYHTVAQASLKTRQTKKMTNALGSPQKHNRQQHNGKRTSQNNAALKSHSVFKVRFVNSDSTVAAFLQLSPDKHKPAVATKNKYSQC